MPSVISLRHPEYVRKIRLWDKYRITYEAGEEFVNKYLSKFSSREDDEDFAERRNLTYVPAFASAGIDEVKNAIYKRFPDVERQVDSESYSDAISGLDGGVDRNHSDMNSFIGDKVLPELLHQDKVGVYVDMPVFDANSTAAEQADAHPYLYIFRARDILSWKFSPVERTLDSVLVRFSTDKVDTETNLPYYQNFNYRFMRRVANGVLVITYDDGGKVLDEKILDLTHIPLHICEMPKSLMSRVADYQIALMQLTSSDLMYIIKSNFPFYIEQGSAWQKLYTKAITNQAEATGTTSAEKEIAESNKRRDADDASIKVGATRGRLYAQGMDAPAFINPSSEPLQISMAKEDQMKKEIRQLIHLDVQSLSGKLASSDSKDRDKLPMESGLSYIGTLLQALETAIAKTWLEYMSEDTDTVQIKYPVNYSINSSAEVRDEIKGLKEDIAIIPSLQFKRQAAFRIARLALQSDITATELREIEKEIMEATVIVGDAATLNKDVESAFLALEDASGARCYPESTVQTAADEHAARLERIAKSQSDNANQPNNNPAARGLPDLSGDPKGHAAAEKLGKPGRGEAQ